MTEVLRFPLDDPWPTPWHRAGVVGLALAVEAFPRERAVESGWSFDVEDRAVVVSAARKELCWEGLEAVRRDAYTADHLGIIGLPQVRGGAIGARLFAHEAYLDVFSIQGATSRAVDADKAASCIGLSKDAQTQVTFFVDEEPRLLSFHAQRHGQHGDAKRALTAPDPGKRDLRQWLVPGCSGGGDKEVSLAHGNALEEVVLAFAPCGLLFVAFQTTELQGKVNLRHAALLPEWSEAATLGQAVIILRRWGREPGQILPGGRRRGALGLAHALLTVGDVSIIAGLRVVESGTSLVSKYKVPRGSDSLARIPPQVLRRLREAYALFPPVPARSWEPGGQPSTCLGLIADNAVAGCPLYTGFTALCASKALFERICQENRGRQGLRRIIMTRPEDAGIGRLEEDLLAIIDACIKVTFARAAEGKEEKAVRVRAWNAAREKLRVTFHAARSHASTRFAVVDLMSRASLPEELRTAPDWEVRRATLFRLLDSPQHWTKVRDLCLFALASYVKQGQDDSDVPEAAATDDNVEAQ